MTAGGASERRVLGLSPKSLRNRGRKCHFLAATAVRLRLIEQNLALPGVTLRSREGMGPLPGDTPFLGLHMASRARAYLENMPASRARKGVARRLSRAELEQRLEGDLSSSVVSMPIF